MSNIRPVVTDNNDEDRKKIESWTLKSLQLELSAAPHELVPGLISKNLTMFQGDAGCGKSLIASDLATAYSTGTNFLGKFPINVNVDRPKVCYVDQDNFSQEALVSRLTAFGCNSENLVIPKDYWFRLDDMPSVLDFVHYLNDNRVGLLILDSIGSFHKLRDGKLEYLRDSFQTIISPGVSVVILSHILKSSSATDKKAAQGTGLVQATDYTFGFVEVGFGKFKISPVKIRQGRGEVIQPFLVSYSGQSRPVEHPDPTISELLISHLLEVGAKGTTLTAIRKRVPGDDHVKSELLKSSPEVYFDGKRGPGSHIWHVDFRPTTDSDVCNESDAIDDESDEETLFNNRCSYTEFGECDSDYEFPV
jgi:hypothetical protein